MIPAGTFFATLKLPVQEAKTFAATGSFIVKLSEYSSYLKLMFRTSVASESAVFDISYGHTIYDGSIVYTKMFSGVTIATGTTSRENGTFACNDIAITTDLSGGAYAILGGAPLTVNDNKILAIDTWGSRYIKIDCTTAVVGANVTIDLSEI